MLDLFLAMLQNEQSGSLLCKGQARVELYLSFPCSILLPGNNNHSARKLLKDTVLQAPMGSLRVTMCYGLMSHNNGNLWFTLFDSLFLYLVCAPWFRPVLSSFDFTLSPPSLSLYFIALYGLGHLTLPLRHIKHPPQVTQEPHQQSRRSFNTTYWFSQFTNTHLTIIKRTMLLLLPLMATF